MKVWIDAAVAGAERQVLGMTPVERHVRAAMRAGAAAEDIIVDGGTRSVAQTQDLLGNCRDLPVRLVSGTGDVAQRLQSCGRGENTETLAMAGDVVADPRLFPHLAGESGTVVATDHSEVAHALPSGFAMLYGDWGDRGDGQTCLLKLAAGTPLPAADNVTDLGTRLLQDGVTQRFDSTGRNKHLAMQRRDVPFWIRPVPDAARCRNVERFLFDASYKGSTDVITRYVFPYLVWPIVLFCVRQRIHPNTITIVSIVATFAAVPFFAVGWWFPGLLLAWLMGILDSVDGKVARLTMTDSRLGAILDHGLDIIHPPVWYLAWAIGLSGLKPISGLFSGHLFAKPIFLAALLMFALYVADRLVLAVYKQRFRRGLHSHGPIDAAVRGIISRRNVNLALFTIALIFGWGEFAFYVIVGWQLATVLWHALRTAWILGRREMPPLPT